MSAVPTLTTAVAFGFSLGGDRVLVIAQGFAPTSGWSAPRLSPRFYIAPPQDGYWEFDFVADEPTGIVLQVQLPLVADGIFSPPGWMKGIRVIGGNRSIDIEVANVAKSTKTISSVPGPLRFLEKGHVILRQEIASYDDSFNPIGWCEFPLHVRMKKLHHTLTLVVEGPDEGKIRQCIAQAAGAGLIAAIVAAYATAGLALQAAVTAFLSSLQGCLGNSFTCKVEDKSDWIEWCT